MDTMTIKTDAAAIVDTFTRTSTALKGATEFTDNLLQYAKGRDGHIIVDEKNLEIYFIDNGSGFNFRSFEKYHQIFGNPIDTNGCSRYSIGSKIFGSLAFIREVYSINSQGQEFASCWDLNLGKTSYSELPSSSKDHLSKKLSEYGFKTGTIVRLRKVHWGKEYNSASAFYKAIKNEFDDRYAYYLFKNKTTLTINFHLNNGEIQTHKVKSVDIFKNSKHNIPRNEITDDQEFIEFFSFYHPDVRGTSNQGIEIYYDNIKIHTAEWKRYTSRQGYSNRSSHNSLNNCRQVVFLNSVNSKLITIDQNKSSCELPEKIYKQLATDLDTVAHHCKKVRKSKATKELNSSKGTKYDFKVGLEEFIGTYETAPFKEGDESIVFNKESQLFNRLTKMTKEDRSLLIKMIESLYICNRKDSREIKDFLKEFSVLFESSLD